MSRVFRVSLRYKKTNIKLHTTFLFFFQTSTTSFVSLFFSTLYNTYCIKYTACARIQAQKLYIAWVYCVCHSRITQQQQQQQQGIEVEFSL